MSRKKDFFDDVGTMDEHVGSAAEPVREALRQPLTEGSHERHAIVRYLRKERGKFLRQGVSIRYNVRALLGDLIKTIEEGRHLP